MENIESEQKERGSILRRTAVWLVESFLIGILYLTKLLSYILPPAVLQGIYVGFGSVLYYAIYPVRRLIIKNISRALPEITDPREIDRIGRKSLCGAILPMLDLILFDRYSDVMMREMKVEGLEYVHQADALGKGLIILSSHIGSFTLTVPVAAHLGVPFTPIVTHPDHTPLPRWVESMYSFGEPLGCNTELPYIFTKEEDTREKAREHLRRGGRLGITIDVMGRGGAELFGRPAAMASGIAHFAYDTGAVIMPSLIQRKKGVLERRGVAFEPLTYELTDDREKDIKIIMREVMGALERAIRETPEQWTNWIALGGWWQRGEELEERGI